jgi:hypothetical protein
LRGGSKKSVAAAPDVGSHQIDIRSRRRSGSIGGADLASHGAVQRSDLYRNKGEIHQLL